MDDVKDVAVTFDFLLAAVLRRRLIVHQLGESSIGRDDSLNLVAGLRALDFGEFDELIKLFRLLLQVQVLPSLKFVDQSDVVDNFSVEASCGELRVVEFFAHLSHNPFCLHINYI